MQGPEHARTEVGSSSAKIGRQRVANRLPVGIAWKLAPTHILQNVAFGLGARARIIATDLFPKVLCIWKAKARGAPKKNLALTE